MVKARGWGALGLVKPLRDGVRCCPSPPSEGLGAGAPGGRSFVTHCALENGRSALDPSRPRWQPGTYTQARRPKHRFPLNRQWSPAASPSFGLPCPAFLLTCLTFPPHLSHPFHGASSSGESSFSWSELIVETHWQQYLSPTGRALVPWENTRFTRENYHGAWLPESGSKVCIDKQYFFFP